MGGVVSKVGLVALRAVLGGAAVEAAHRAARAAAEPVFDAIAEAAEAAANYVSALYRAVASAVADAYVEVKRVVAQACDAVKRAATCISSRVVELIGCLHGDAAGASAKNKLDGVNFLVRAGDVAALVAAIVNGIKRVSSPMFPNLSPGEFLPAESEKAKRAASSADEIMEALCLVASAVVKMLGFEIPKVAISVIAIAAKLVFAILFP